MRIKSQWFRPQTPKTPQQTASALAFIVWRLAENMLKQMRSARFDIDVGLPYFAFMREVLVFLIQVVDRMAFERMPATTRAEFTTALVRRVAEILEDSENDLLGVPPPGLHTEQDLGGAQLGIGSGLGFTPPPLAADFAAEFLDGQFD